MQKQKLAAMYSDSNTDTSIILRQHTADVVRKEREVIFIDVLKSVAEICSNGSRGRQNMSAIRTNERECVVGRSEITEEWVAGRVHVDMFEHASGNDVKSRPNVVVQIVVDRVSIAEEEEQLNRERTTVLHKHGPLLPHLRVGVAELVVRLTAEHAYVRVDIVQKQEAAAPVRLHHDTR